MTSEKKQINIPSININSIKLLKPIKRSSNSQTKIDSKYSNEMKTIVINTSQKQIITNTNLDNSSDLIMQQSSRSAVSYKGIDIKGMCTKIFMNFAKVSIEDNQFYLSYVNLNKILKDIKLAGKELKSIDLDIILQKINPNGSRLTFDQFLDLLANLARKIDANFLDDPQLSITNLVKMYFEPLISLDEIIPVHETKTNFNIVNSNASFLNGKNSNLNKTTVINSHESLENLIDTFQITSGVKIILESIYTSLKEIYTAYFHYEINRYTDRKKIITGSFKNLIEFLKDYEIIPYLVNLNQISIYWKLMIYQELNIPLDKRFHFGNIFTFSKFCLMIFHLSILFDRKTRTENLYSDNEVEKLVFFLEKLQRSNGFQNLERRTNKPHNDKVYLIPSNEVIQKIDSHLALQMTGKIDYKKEKYSNLNSNMSLNLLNFTNFHEIANSDVIKNYNRNPNKFLLRQIMTISDETYSLLEPYLENLKELFEEYSKMMDKMNTSKMSFSLYQKFLRDYNIMRLSNSDKIIDKKSMKMDKSQIHIFSIKSREPYLKTKNFSKSPLRTKNFISSSEKNFHSRLGTQYNSNQKYLNEIDINIVFESITGFKNFDNKKNIHKQFNKNPGVSDEIGQISNSCYIDKPNILHPNTSNMPHKLDFFLFIKSFELLALKLYPNDENDVNYSMNKFIEINLTYITHIFKEKFKSVKKEIKDILEEIRTHEIVLYKINFFRERC